MNPESIFYWTGCVFWWGVCATAILCIISAFIISPIFVFHRFRSVWWKWATLGRFANLGWSQDQLRRIATEAGLNDDFLKMAKGLLDAASNLKR